jgi:hypothetical protein
MRLSIVGWQTTTEDICRSVAAILFAAREEARMTAGVRAIPAAVCRSAS